MEGDPAKREGQLTPRQRLRQLVPSWFLRGQTTSLFWSEREKELVREARGGMACMYPSSDLNREGRAEGDTARSAPQPGAPRLTTAAARRVLV